MNRILTCFVATHAGMVSSNSSSRPYGPPSTYNGMLPYRSSPKAETRSFGDGLESRSLSAQEHLTSELLRTL